MPSWAKVAFEGGASAQRGGENSRGTFLLVSPLPFLGEGPGVRAEVASRPFGLVEGLVMVDRRNSFRAAILPGCALQEDVTRGLHQPGGSEGFRRPGFPC